MNAVCYVRFVVQLVWSCLKSLNKYIELLRSYMFDEIHWLPSSFKCLVTCYIYFHFSIIIQFLFIFYYSISLLCVGRVEQREYICLKYRWEMYSIFFSFVLLGAVNSCVLSDGHVIHKIIIYKIFENRQTCTIHLAIIKKK